MLKSLGAKWRLKSDFKRIWGGKEGKTLKCPHFFIQLKTLMFPHSCSFSVRLCDLNILLLIFWRIGNDCDYFRVPLPVVMMSLSLTSFCGAAVVDSKFCL